MEPSDKAETEIYQLFEDVREALRVEARALNAAAVGMCSLDAERVRIAALCGNAAAASRAVSDLCVRIRKIEAGLPERPSVLRMLAAWSDDEMTICRTILERLRPREPVGMDLPYEIAQCASSKASGLGKNEGGAA